MTTEDDIDRLLREEGERWRAEVPVNTTLDPSQFRGRPVASRFWLVGGPAAALGAAALVIALIVNAGWPSSAVGPSPSSPGAATGTAAPQSTATVTPDPLKLVVRPGDRVIATGWLATPLPRAAGVPTPHPGDVYLCPTKLAYLASRPLQGPGCAGAPMVVVRGIDGSAWNGRYATVRGTWDGEAVQATGATAAAPPDPEPFTLPAVPCDPPAGGWPGNVGAGDSDAAALALEREVGRHPEAYVGIWVAANEEAGQVVLRVVVVGTVEDVPSVTARLSEIYPYNLCVVGVQFSARDLQPVAADLSSREYGWLVDLEPRVDRVVVSVTALSDSAAQALAPYTDKIELRATLHPAPDRLGLEPGSDLEAARLAVIQAVNLDPDNFGVPYLDTDGVLVVPYVGANPGRPAIEQLLVPGLAIRWEQVEYPRSELRRIATEISDLRLPGVFGVSSGTNRNRVIVYVVPWGSVQDVSQLLTARYGDAVQVEFSTDIPLVLPATPAP